METLSEIVNAESARRQRALKYETALTAVSEAKLKIEHLNAKTQDAETLKVLTRIMDDSNKLPGDVTGSVGGLVPVAGVVRTFIHALAATGYNQVLSREQQREQALNAAKAALAKAEGILAEFE
jgi:hypothetical protein